MNSQTHLADSSERPLAALSKDRARFVSFVRRKVRSGADAEDLVQQALVRATERISTLKASDRVEAWFYRILRNTIADHHAAWALREKKLHELAKDAESGTPEEVAACACSLGLLERIPPDYREMLTRADIEEEPIAEIAAMKGLTVNNASVRLHRARKALREELLSFCGTETARDCAECGCE